jgi:hypothetical protein
MYVETLITLFHQSLCNYKTNQTDIFEKIKDFIEIEF